MNIILTMAGNTFAGRFLVSVVRVTTDATYLRVQPCQWKIRLIVIKAAFCPGLGVMAGCTVITQATCVGIILLMAAVTAHFLMPKTHRALLIIRGAGGGVCLVTGSTDQCRVRTGQGEVCEVMIEQIDHQPGDVRIAAQMFTVTLAAFRLTDLSLKAVKALP